MELSWREIIEGCKRNERRFQLAAYDHSWRVLFPSVYRIIRNKQEAEDIMQDSIIRGFDKLSQLSNPDAYLAWQKNISIRMAYNYLRDKKRHEVEFPNWEGEEQNTDSEIAVAWPEPARLLEIVHSLAGGYQMVVKMHLLEGMPHEEIAVIMGITPSTVRSQYSRALQRIREIIHEQQRQHV